MGTKGQNRWRRRLIRRVRVLLARLVFLLLLLSATVLVAVWSLLETEAAGSFAIEKALPLINEALPGRIELGGYEGQIGKHLILTDVVIYDERDDVAARVQRVELWWDVWDLTRLNVGVSRADIQHAEVLVDLREDGTLNWVGAFVKPKPEGWVKPEKPDRSSPLVVAVDVVNLSNTSVVVNIRGEQRFEFTDIDLEGSYALERGLHDVAINRLGVDTQAPWDLPPATIAAEARLDDLDLIVDAFSLELDGNRIELDGRLTQLNNLRFEGLNVRSEKFDLELLKAFSPKIPLQKSVSVDLTVDGRLDQLTASGEIGGELGRIGLTDVAIGVAQKPLTHAGTLDIDGFALAELLPYPGLPPSITVDLSWDGEGTNLDSLKGDLSLDAKAFEVEGVKLDGHSLRGHIEDGVVTAHHRDLIGGGVVEGDATVWLTEGRFQADKTTLENVRLSAFRKVSRGGVRDGRVNGWLTAKGSWEERPIRIQTEGDLKVVGLEVPSTAIARSRTRWENLEVTLAKGAPSVTGHVDLRATHIRINGTEQVSEAHVVADPTGQASAFAVVANRGPELLTELDGEVDWAELPTIKVRGDRLMVLAGTLLAETHEGESFNLKTRSGSVQLDRLQLYADDLRLTAQAVYQPGGDVRAQTRITSLDLGPQGQLSEVLPLLPEATREKVEALGLDGEIREIFARIGGTLADPELELRVVGQELVALGRPPMQLDATARLEEDGLTGEIQADTLANLTIRELPASLSFEKGQQLLTLAPDGAWDIELDLPETSLGRVATLAQQELPEAITSGSYRGGVTWRGTTAEPDIRMALSVADVTVEARAEGAQEGTMRKVNAKVGALIQEGALTLPSSFFRTDKEGRIVTFDGGAQAPLGEFLLARFGPDADPSTAPAPFQALELGAHIKNLPLPLAHVFVPALRPLSGSVTGDLTIGGELDAPEATADLRLLAGRAGDQELKTASVAVAMADDRLTLDMTLEAAKGGNLEAHGGVTFPVRKGADFKTLLDHDDLDVVLGGDGFPIAVLLAFVPDTYDVSGALTIGGTVTGSLRTPVPNVALAVPNGRLCHEKTWICYEKVMLNASIVPGLFTLTEASFKTFPRSRNPLATRTWNTSDKAAGGFHLAGYAELEGFTPGLMDFDFDFDHMWVSSEETMQAQMDGGLSVDGVFPALQIGGDLDLENILVDIGHEDIGRSVTPMQLPENLVVHREESRAGPGERRKSLVDRSQDPSKTKEILEALNVDVGIHLTNNVKVKLAVGLAGQGPAKVLNTLGRVEPDLTLKGDVRVLMQNAQPKLEGRIETNRGSRLTALTKKFSLEDGSGVDLIGDPMASQLGLTGVHSTRYGDVRVKVTGSVLEPRIVFESDEFDDQADIMALLVTGKPLSELTAAQGSSAMSGVGAALTGWVSNTFGKYVPVDLLEVDLGDDFSSGSVEAGKAITPWLFLISRFRWGAEDDENTIEGQVELAFPGTRNLYLEVVIGDRLVGSAELIFKVLY